MEVTTKPARRRRKKIKFLREIKRCIKYCEYCNRKFLPEELTFHHRNPKEKRFSMSGGHGNRHAVVSRGFLAVIKEFYKCDVICKECHREVHKKVS